MTGAHDAKRLMDASVACARVAVKPPSDDDASRNDVLLEFP
jgi:hypothetical protein